MSEGGNNLIADDAFRLAPILEFSNTGIWEYNVTTKDIKCSAGFYAILGYKPGEIDCSYNFFLDKLLYHQDKALFLGALNANIDILNTIQIRLLTKESGYQWFESASKKWQHEEGPVVIGTIVNIHRHKLAELNAIQQKSSFKDIGALAKVTCWEMDVHSQTLRLMRDTYDMCGFIGKEEFSIEEASGFFEPHYRSLFKDAIADVIKHCRPFDMELAFKVPKTNAIWIKAKGQPVIDDFGNCIKIQGIFQDIDSIKKSGSDLQSSIDLLNDQNRRLQNFAYIVSHNLRSHTGNLQFMVNLHEESESASDQAEVFAHIKSISNSLHTTIEHLNEIVKMHTDPARRRKNIEFESVFKNVLSALKSNIDNTGAKIDYDFSGCPQINYIPAYLESIFQNLLTNSLKYRHADREPVVKCRTTKERKNIYLLFEDNGMGIDMERYGDKIFGMYKTFHHNPDSKGLGLFITRNQVEALGGSIQVDSKVDVGTKFTIKLV